MQIIKKEGGGSKFYLYSKRLLVQTNSKKLDQYSKFKVIVLEKFT